MAAISPPLILCLSPEDNDLFSRPQVAVGRRRRFITNRASGRLGFLPTVNTDVLDSGSSHTLRQQQRPTACPTASPGSHSERLDMDGVLYWAETYRRSESQRHRLEALEQAQRAVRHEGLDLPPESQPSPGLLVPMATMPVEAVSMTTTDACTQTEEIKCHRLLGHEKSTEQHPITDLLRPHDNSSPLHVREHIYPPFTFTCDDWHTIVPCSALKRNDTHEAFNHTPAHPQLDNADSSVSARKNRKETNSTMYEKTTAISLTQQTTHVNSDNTQSQTSCTDRLTQTDVEKTESRNNVASPRNQKHVSFSKGHTNNCSTNSSCFLSQGQPSTPLFFHNLRHMQWKIMTGQVDRKIYMDRCQHGLASTRAVVSAGALFSRGHHIS